MSDEGLQQGVSLQLQRFVHMTPSLEVAWSLPPVSTNKIGKCEATLHALAGGKSKVRAIECDVYARVACLSRQLEILAK